MVETTATGTGNNEAARDHFNRALEEAKAGAQALGKEAQAMAEDYKAKFSTRKEELAGEARTRAAEHKEKASAMAADAKIKASDFADEAKVRAADLAAEAKAKTSQGIVAVSKLIDDNLGLIDGKAGVKYGDYARSTSQTMKDAAARLDEKSFDELGEDAKAFVRKSPGVAVGLAVAAGFLVGRVFKGK